MDRNRRGAATAAVLGVVVVLAAACSGNSGASSSSSGSSASVDSAVLGDKKAATGTPVKIGLLNVEGGSAVSEPEIGDSAQAAADYANDYLGGLDGHKIEVVRCGDKADGASAAACANQFVQDGVAAVVVGQAATADTFVPVVQGAGIPYFGASPAAASELADDNAYFVSSGFLGLLAAEAVYSKQQGYKTVTMFGAENPQLVSAVNAVGKPLFQGQGVTLDLVTVPQGTADATSQVTAGTTSKPDAVSVVADATVCQSVLTALNTVGSTVPKYVNSASVAQSVLDGVGEAGIDGSVLFTSGDTNNADQEETALYMAVMQQYAPDVDIHGIAANGYLAMLGLVRAVNTTGLSGDPTPESVAAAIKGAKDVPLPIGDGS